jgi:predicted lipoprotein
MRKTNGWIVKLAVAAVFVALVALTCRVTVVWDKKSATALDANGNEVAVAELSVAEQYCLDNWETKMLPAINEKAIDVATVVEGVKADLTAYGAQNATRENATSAYNFCVEGKVKVLEIENPEKDSKRRLLIDVMPYDGLADAKVQISSVIKTNALRDAVGFLKLDDFGNQVAFAELTKAFNARVQKDVLATLKPEALVGKEIALTGCVAVSSYTDADSILIVPVSIVEVGG